MEIPNGRSGDIICLVADPTNNYGIVAMKSLFLSLCGQITMEIDFDPNIRLQSTFYPVLGYETDFHVLTYPTPPFPGRDALFATGDPFKRE